MPSPAFYGISLMVLYLIVILEVYLLNRWQGQPMRWREVAVNMNSGQAMLWLLQGVRIWTYTLVYERLSPHLLSGLPTVVLWPLSFLLWDLAFYTSHRLHHRIPVLWDVHAVHHQGESFNISLAVRNAWLQVLTPTPFFAVLALIGVPPAVFLSMGALHYTIQLYNHNGLTLAPSPLDLFMITPRHHRVHHAKDRRYYDRNFGSALVIWDRLFGTFAEERSELPLEIGLEDAPRSENPLWLNLEPLTRRLGWGDANARLPAHPLRLGEAWLMGGSLLHFFLLCLYIMAVGVWPTAESAALLAFIIVGTMLLGGAADGGRRALMGWALLGVGGAALGVLGMVSSGPSALVIAVVGLLGVGAMHGLWGLGALRA